MKMAPMKRSTPTGIPTPRPIFAPVERPEEGRFPAAAAAVAEAEVEAEAAEV